MIWKILLVLFIGGVVTYIINKVILDRFNLKMDDWIKAEKKRMENANKE